MFLRRSLCRAAPPGAIPERGQGRGVGPLPSLCHCPPGAPASWTFIDQGPPVIRRRQAGSNPLTFSLPLRNRVQHALEGGKYSPPPPHLQGVQPTPSHCPPDGKCQAQWHL